MKYARKCSITNEPLNEGWIDEGSVYYLYFKYKKDVIKHIKELMDEDEFLTFGGKRSDDDILEVGYNFYNIYWTEWQDEIE